jgi:hypothetical protein
MLRRSSTVLLVGALALVVLGLSGAGCETDSSGGSHDDASDGQDADADVIARVVSELRAGQPQLGALFDTRVASSRVAVFEQLDAATRDRLALAFESAVLSERNDNSARYEVELVGVDGLLEAEFWLVTVDGSRVVRLVAP